MSIFGMEYGLEFADVRWIPCHEHTHLGCALIANIILISNLFLA